VQPLLLVFEDLHWIDTETQALLDSLVESLPTAPLLLLVNYRPEYEHGWHRKTYYQQLRLDPLPAASAAELLDALVGQDHSLAPLKQLLIERTEGNPFFLEESVRTLVETGILAGERGGYRLAKPLQSTQVPATVHAVLAARIDRLTPEDKRLLQAAAVIGKDVPHALLRAIADTDDAALAASLAQLQEAEFLYETALFPDLEYTFKHALTHEVAYGSLLHERRRALHTRIVEAIETLYADRKAEYVEFLAHHALRGEVWDKAVVYQQQAGAKAAARSAYREAAEHLEQAVLALARLPEDPETRGQAIDLRLELYRSRLPLGELTRANALQEDLEERAEALGDPVRLARVYALVTARSRRDGDYERCVEFAQRTLGLASAVDEQTVQNATHHNLGMAYFALGDYRAALGCFRRNMTHAIAGEMSRQIAPLTYPVVAGAWASECLAQLGEFAEGTTLAAEALRAAEATNLPWDLAMTLLAEGDVYLAQGVFPKAASALERGVTLCESTDITYFSRVIPVSLGHAYTLSDRLAEAVHLLEGAEQRPGELGGHETGGESCRVAHLSEAYLRAGRQADAGEAAGRALALARERKERGNQAWALRLLGEIAAQADPSEVERAEDYYCEALALANELGMRPLVAHCHLGLGTLYQKLGQQEQAQAELATAADMYRAMEMTFWLEQTEVALAQSPG
jgi:tetratricopeptide (TPR) repeat protein